MSNNPQTASQLYVPTKNSKKKLTIFVFVLKNNIKRVTSVIAPQAAQYMIDKHNRSSPTSQWRLNQTDPMGPATSENLTDNNQGKHIHRSPYMEPLYIRVAKNVPTSTNHKKDSTDL